MKRTIFAMCLVAMSTVSAWAGPITVFGSASQPAAGFDSATCTGIDACGPSGGTFINVSGTATGTPGHIRFTSVLIAPGFNTDVSVTETASASFSETVSYQLFLPSFVRLTFSLTNEGGAPIGNGQLKQTYFVNVAGDPQQSFSGPFFQFGGSSATETFSVDPSAGQFALTVQGDNSGKYSSINISNGMSSEATLDLTRIEFLDANGDPASPVPEPSGLLLAAAGLLMVVIRKRHGFN